MEASVNFIASIAVSNFPASQAVTGAVSISNLPATQPVSGTVAVSNLPASQAVTGSVSVSNLPVTQPVSGSVSVANLPASQAVTGTVSVSNFPADPPTQTTLAAVLAKIIAAPATAALQSTIDATLNAIKALLPTALIANRLDVNIGASSATVPVSGAVTTSGTSTVTQGASGASAWPVSLASAPLPLDAATQTTSAAILAKQPSAPALETGNLAAIATSTASTTTNTSSTATKLAGGLPAALGAAGGVKVEGVAGGTAVPVTNALGATAAAQTTSQASFTSLDTKTPALGQALAAASRPVVLTAIQAAALAQDASLVTITARCLLGQGAAAAARTVISPSDYTLRIIEAAPGGVPWSDIGPTLITPSTTVPQQLLAVSATRRVRTIRPTFNKNAAAVNVAVFNSSSGVWGTDTFLVDYFTVGGAAGGNTRDYVGGILCVNGVWILLSTTSWIAAYAVSASPMLLNGVSA